MEVKKPKKRVFDLICIGMIYFAIELAFSIEIALTVPILVKMKVSEKYAFALLLNSIYLTNQGVSIKAPIHLCTS